MKKEEYYETWQIMVSSAFCGNGNGDNGTHPCGRYGRKIGCDPYQRYSRVLRNR